MTVPDGGSTDAGNTFPHPEPDAGVQTPDAGNEETADAGEQARDAGNNFGRDAGNGNHTDAGSSTSQDAGSFSSSLTASGGTESQLYFAVIGDTRPYNQDDTANYPASPPLSACTASTVGSVTSTKSYCGVINRIYDDIQGMTPRPPLVISTGDYQYVTPGMGDSSTQLGYYKTARAGFSGVEWPAMGNHECDGYTASNCANGCPSGDSCSGSNTENYLNFQSLFRGPSWPTTEAGLRISSSSRRTTGTARNRAGSRRSSPPPGRPARATTSSSFTTKITQLEILPP
jgi:hypothetical protein